MQGSLASSIKAIFVILLRDYRSSLTSLTTPSNYVRVTLVTNLVAAIAYYKYRRGLST